MMTIPAHKQTDLKQGLVVATEPPHSNTMLCLQQVAAAGYGGITAKDIDARLADVVGGAVKAHKRLPELEKRGLVARALMADGTPLRSPRRTAQSANAPRRMHQVWVLPEHAKFNAGAF